MKIFNASQIRDWDAFTIDREPVSSLELMNRAAGVFTDWFTRLYPDTQRPVIVLAGTGNNGGDGVAVARLLYRRFYAPKVLVCDFSGRHSADFDAQIANLPADQAVPVQWLDPAGEWPDLPAGAVVIEALFGTGLSRPLEGKWAEAVEWINRLPNEVVSIDLPAGLSADAHTGGACVRADRCFSFQQPKKAFFFPENSAFAGEWTFGDIGLSPEYAAQTPTDFYYLDNVPWTMYFDKARALHGAYWRTRFGYPQSHGCVNLSVGDAHWLYNWANEGDWVYVHDPSGLTPTDPALYHDWAY